jgi:hypothetical protein
MIDVAHMVPAAAESEHIVYIDVMKMMRSWLLQNCHSP